MAPPRHALPKKKPRWKRHVARWAPHVGAVALVIGIWENLLAEGSSPRLLAMKTAAIVGAVEQTRSALEAAGRLPAWLDSNPDNDE